MKKIIASLMLFALLLSGCAPAPGKESGGTAENTPAAEIKEDAASHPQNSTNAENTEKSADRSEAFVNIIKSNQYFMKARVQDEGGVLAFSVSVDGDNIAMETAADGKTYNTVIRDGVTYMIDHQSKMVITSGAEVSSAASNMAGDALRADGITFVKSGEGAFMGETLSFDEYQTPAGGTLRFYLRDSSLAGIEGVDGGEAFAYQIEELSAGHRKEMHEIPSAYTVLDMAALGG